MKYEPKEGTGWQEGTTLYAGIRRWQLQIDGDTWLRVTVTEKAGFVVSRGMGDAHTVPHPEDLGRIERDFGVHGWRIEGVMPVFVPSVGQALLARAVQPGEERLE